MRLLIVITLALLAVTNTVAQTQDSKLKINGFLDSYHAVRVKSPNDFLSSRTRLRGELSKTLGKSSFFLSFNLNQNSILKEQDIFELREAFLDYSTKNWSLRIGRQLIIWGAADGVRITDLVSPMDMTEFLARDYDDIRMPVEAFKFRYFNEILKLEIIYIPIFKGFIIPTDPKNPWTVPLPATSNAKRSVLSERKPNFALKNSEIGGRLTFNLPGVDFSLAALHTYNKMPVFLKYKKNDTLFISPEYHRMTFIGGDVSKPLGQFVLRSEVAFNMNKSMTTHKLSRDLCKHNTLHALIGIDWYAPKEWMLSAQISDEKIYNHNDELTQEEHTSLLTFNVSKPIFNNTLKLSNFLYTDLNYGSFFSRFSADYSLTDQIHLFVGYDHFNGEKGNFGVYKDNSEIWIKAKYNF